MSKRQQFCLQGHNTYITGRTPGGNCILCARYRTNAWRKKHPERARRTVRRYLIIDCPPEPPKGTPCEICGGIPNKALSADHDHATLRFRGWICNKCNMALGVFHDSVSILQSAVRYLQK